MWPKPPKFTFFFFFCFYFRAETATVFSYEKWLGLGSLKQLSGEFNFLMRRTLRVSFPSKGLLGSFPASNKFWLNKGKSGQQNLGRIWNVWDLYPSDDCRVEGSLSRDHLWDAACTHWRCRKGGGKALPWSQRRDCRAAQPWRVGTGWGRRSEVDKEWEQVCSPMA